MHAARMETPWVGIFSLDGSLLFRLFSIVSIQHVWGFVWWPPFFLLNVVSFNLPSQQGSSLNFHLVFFPVHLEYQFHDVCSQLLRSHWLTNLAYECTFFLRLLFDPSFVISFVLRATIVLWRNASAGSPSWTPVPPGNRPTLHAQAIPWIQVSCGYDIEQGSRSIDDVETLKYIDTILVFAWHVKIFVEYN